MKMVKYFAIVIVVMSVIIVGIVTVSFGINHVVSDNVLYYPGSEWKTKNEMVYLDINDEFTEDDHRAYSGTCVVRHDSNEYVFEVISHLTYGVELVSQSGDDQRFYLRFYSLSNNSCYAKVTWATHSDGIYDGFPFQEGKWIKIYRVDE